MLAASLWIKRQVSSIFEFCQDYGPWWICYDLPPSQPNVGINFLFPNCRYSVETSFERDFIPYHNTSCFIAGFLPIISRNLECTVDIRSILLLLLQQDIKLEMLYCQKWNHFTFKNFFKVRIFLLWRNAPNDKYLWKWQPQKSTEQIQYFLHI